MNLLDMILQEKRGLLLTPVIDQYLTDREIKKGEYVHKKKSFGPSWICNPCLRYCWYAFHRTKGEPHPIDLVKILDIGNAMHNLVESWVSGSKKLLGANFVLENDDYNLRGKPDLLFITNNNKPAIGEVKSAASFKFKNTSVSILNYPNDDHVVQLNLYMYMFNEKLKKEGEVLGIKEPILTGCIYYLNKVFFTTGNKYVRINKIDAITDKEHIVNYNQDIIDATLAKIRVLQKNISSNSIPDRLFEKTSKDCKRCCFNKICWES